MGNLAIRGHKTREREIMYIFNMLGCINAYNIKMDDEHYVYYIDDLAEACCSLESRLSPKDVLFTLEEFLEKYPYKIEDNVIYDERVYRISDAYWDEVDNVVKYYLTTQSTPSIITISELLQPYKEQEIMKYRLDNSDYNKLAAEITCDDFKVVAPDNYLIGKATKVDGGIIVEYVNKKNKYPKTYEECCRIVNANPSRIIVISNHEGMVHEENKHCFEMHNLYKLLICRDAYWKITGKEMGLGKPWEPDWTDSNSKFIIQTFKNEVGYWSTENTSRLLAFPTKEMRDAFYEDFKDLIDECKELL